MRHGISAVLLYVATALWAVGEESSVTGKVAAATVFTGQCHCGLLAYEVQDGNPVRTDCGCRDCQRATGALTVPFISVRPASFRITKGTGTEFKGSGKGCDQNGEWVFCETCGTTIVWIENGGRFSTVLAGTVNETDVVKKVPARK